MAVFRDTMMFALLLLGAGAALGQSPKLALYAALGPELTAYRLDTAAGTLTRQGSVMLPQNVQEAWTHPSRRFLYVAWSNNVPGARHGLSVFRIDPASGALTPHGPSVDLPARTVYLTLDIPGRHVIAASNNPSGATVHAIKADGTLGTLVPQPAGLDFGIYAHQVRMDPSNRFLVIVTRGNGPTASKAEHPGAIKVYTWKDGVMGNKLSIAPGGGYGFQPRHLDFHPTAPFAFLTVERQNKLQVYRMDPSTGLAPAPLFTKETLRDPAHMDQQATSAIHVHPNGRFVYLGNRATGKAGSGENSIAAYAINSKTGEPTLIQNADTQGVHPRTFAIDPEGKMLVVANMQHTAKGPANLALFRIGADGKLSFVRKYDQDGSGKRDLFWTGIVALP